MNRLVLIFMALFVLIIPNAGQAATTSQCPGTNCENFFNSVSDHMATLGKDPTTAQKIIYQRRKTRRLNRQMSLSIAQKAQREKQMQAWQKNQNLNL